MFLLRIDTKLVHSGEPEPRIGGAVVMPIFQSAMFESRGEKTYDEIRYILLNNTPNHRVLAMRKALETGTRFRHSRNNQL